MTKIHTFTVEAWAFAGIGLSLSFIANAVGLDSIALGVFAATILIAGAAVLGTFMLGIRALIVA